MSENQDGLIQEEWQIDMFRPEDAAGLVELYRAMYGDSYPVKSVYNPDEIIRQTQVGDTYRAIARTKSGQVVGQVAVYRSSPPNRQLYEFGQVMVRQDCRNSDLAFSLTRYAVAEIPAQQKIEAAWGEAVCNHIFTQRMSIKQGFSETAIEIDLMPGESYAQAFDDPEKSAGRISTLVIFRMYNQRPQTIYLPAGYEDTIAFLYEGYDYGHSFVRSETALPEGKTTEGKLDLFAGAGVARITITALGADFDTCLEQMLAEAQNGGAIVFQVFLPLTDSAIGAAVELLRQRGFFIGGCLPRWFGDDGLLMQKIIGTPNFAGIRLYGKRAKKILELIQKDWQENTSL